jgi:hypothetical protein
MHEHDSGRPGFMRSKPNRSGQQASYYRLDVPIGVKPSTNGVDQHKPVQPANEKTRHAAYTALCQALGLSVEHRTALLSRGLNDEDIVRGRYATLPVATRGKIAMDVLGLVKADGIKTSELLRVPGFTKNSAFPLYLAGRAGLLIPIMRNDGTIGGMVLRPDKPPVIDGKTVGKYQWFSSSTRGGPGAVCSAHVPQTPPRLGDKVQWCSGGVDHFLEPQKILAFSDCGQFCFFDPALTQAGIPVAEVSAVHEIVRLTEGPLKAHIAFSKTGMLTIGLPGVGSWRLALSVLKSLGARTVRFAFDSDATSNPNVAGALALALRGLVAAGYEVEVELWESAHKGIDDALAAAATTQTLAGLNAIRHVLDQARRLGSEPRVEVDQMATWVQFYLGSSSDGKALFADSKLLEGILRVKDRDVIEFAAVEKLLRTGGVWSAFDRWCKGKASAARHQLRANQVAKDPRPRIEITCDEHVVVDQALDIIKPDPALFQRGNTLVMVTKASSAGKKRGVVERPEGSVQIQTMPKAVLRRIMCTHAAWVVERVDGQGVPYFVRGHVPGWAVEQLWDLKHWPGVRHLEGVIEAPTTRSDGTLLTAPGYDDETGLLNLPSGDFPPIPDTPNLIEAQRAAADLLAVVNDFPFAGDEHRFAYLAALLTPLVRFAIQGPCPLFLLDANAAGSGKTKLADIVAILATGRVMPRSQYHSDDVEMDKTLLSIALAGDRLTLFDNVPGGFSIGGGSLDAALTGFTKKGRILGESRMSGEVPLSCVFYASGNNIGLRGDALRRVVPIRLETKLDRPEERRDFTIKGDLLDYVKRERSRLVAAALTMIRAYMVAGRPAQGLTPMDYPAWSGVVREAVAWCTGCDPCKARAELVDSDEETTQRKALVQGFANLCSSLGRTHLTAAEMIDAVNDDPANNPELRSLFIEWGRDGKPATAKAVGKQLQKVRRRPISGQCFDRTDTAIRQWFLRSVKAP